MANIVVDGTIGANRLLILDSTGKIPAVDGSQVTAIAAGNIATGTIPIARIDTGSTANKIVVLDGSGRLPAVSAALITNIPGATKSASDPVIATNPSGGVGTEWHNTTSGEVYICTDATAGANVWTNVGAGSGDVVPWVFQGSAYGYLAGGYHNTAPAYAADVIDKFSFTSNANATDVGNLIEGRYSTAGAASSTHGFISGGYGAITTYTDAIEKFSLVSDGNSVDTTANLTVNVNQCGSCHTSTHGYVIGGLEQPAGSDTNVIQRYSFVSTADSTDVGDATAANNHISGCSSTTHGYYYNGEAGNIGKFAFGSSVTSSSVGNMLATVRAHNGSSSTTYGYRHSSGSTNIRVIEKVSFSSDGNSTNVGNVTARPSNTESPGGASSTTHGYSTGGAYPPSNIIDKYSFASDGDATDVGDLTLARGYIGGGNIQV